MQYLIIVFLSIWGASVASAQNYLPPIVAAEVTKTFKDCGGSESSNPDFIVRKDINGDGVEDYILNYGSLECHDMRSFFCGSGGCLTQIFASLPKGSHASILNDVLRGVDFGKNGNFFTMTLTLHGSACGKIGAQSCRKVLFWNGQNFVSR